jgi:hypothetical protein
MKLDKSTIGFATAFLALLYGLLVWRGVATGRPKPVGAWTPVPLRESTPTPTATPGWWATVSLTPPKPGALPTIPNVKDLGGAGFKAGEKIPFQTVSCPTDGVKITNIYTERPGWWAIFGVATIPNMNYWKAEISPDGKHLTLLYRSAATVGGGLLVEFKTGTVPGGTYFMRLLAVDETGNYPKPCTIQVEVK